MGRIGPAHSQAEHDGWCCKMRQFPFMLTRHVEDKAHRPMLGTGSPNFLREGEESERTRGKTNSLMPRLLALYKDEKEQRTPPPGNMPVRTRVSGGDQAYGVRQVCSTVTFLTGAGRSIGRGGCHAVTVPGRLGSDGVGG